MAADREGAKLSATDPEKTDPEFSATLSAGRSFQIELLKEQNRHKEALAELGWFANIFGGKDNAPIVIAAIALFLGFVMTGACMAFAATYPEDRQFWFDWSKTTFTISGAALGFIFGRKG